jgi:hypothetical protein
MDRRRCLRPPPKRLNLNGKIQTLTPSIQHPKDHNTRNPTHPKHNRRSHHIITPRSNSPTINSTRNLQPPTQPSRQRQPRHLPNIPLKPRPKPRPQPPSANSLLPLRLSQRQHLHPPHRPPLHNTRCCRPRPLNTQKSTLPTPLPVPPPRKLNRSPPHALLQPPPARTQPWHLSLPPNTTCRRVHIRTTNAFQDLINRGARPATRPERGV